MGFFFKAGLGCAAGQLGQNIVQGDITRSQHHQKVIQHIGRLRCERCVIAFNSLNQRLNSFFPKFLGAFLRTL